MLLSRASRMCDTIIYGRFLSAIGGGYGLIACLYGLPKNHQNLYVIHLFLAIGLLVTSVASFLSPKPRQETLFGTLLVITGVWMNVMARLGEAADGSPEVFAVWGSGLALVGILALVDCRRFYYLSIQIPQKAEVKNAGIIVKKLLCANPKKQLDTMTMHINADSDQPCDAALSDRYAVTRNTGKWKVRLLSNVMVLVQGGSARTLVLSRSDFSVPNIPETSSDSICPHSVCISGRVYRVLVTQSHAQRLTQWLMTKE